MSIQVKIYILKKLCFPLTLCLTNFVNELLQLQYMKLKPSLKVYKGVQPKCLMLPELHFATNPGAASSNSTSSESDA